MLYKLKDKDEPGGKQTKTERSGRRPAGVVLSLVVFPFVCWLTAFGFTAAPACLGEWLSVDTRNMYTRSRSSVFLSVVATFRHSVARHSNLCARASHQLLICSAVPSLFPVLSLLSRLFFGFACGLVRTTRLVVLSFLVLGVAAVGRAPSLLLLYDVARNSLSRAKGAQAKKLR